MPLKAKLFQSIKCSFTDITAVKSIFKAIHSGRDWNIALSTMKAENDKLVAKRLSYVQTLEKEMDAALRVNHTSDSSEYEALKTKLEAEYTNLDKKPVFIIFFSDSNYYTAECQKCHGIRDYHQTVEEVSRLLRQYDQMSKMIKQLSGQMIGKRGKKKMKLPFRM